MLLQTVISLGLVRARILTLPNLKMSYFSKWNITNICNILVLHFGEIFMEIQPKIAKLQMFSQTFLRNE